MASMGIYLWSDWEKTQAPQIPTAEVKLDEFVDYVELRGEIKVRSSAVISAPYSAGDLQILKLCRNGATVRKGDVVIEFDPSSLMRNADRLRSDLRQVEAEIQRANANWRMREEQLLTDVAMANLDLERARLDASTKDVVTPIENEKNVLALAKAEQKSREAENKISSSKIAAEADLAGVLRKRDKVKADLAQAERSLAALTLTAPTDGIVTLLPNFRARTSIMGGNTPVFKEGDRPWAGAAIAEVPDLSTIQANAQVDETDRGKVSPGQTVILRIEGVPDKDHMGVVSDISPLAKLDYTSYPFKKNFDLTARLNQPDSRLLPGMTASFRVEVERLPNSIVVPAEAVFNKVGQPVAYVLEGHEFQERPLKVARRGNGQILVESGLRQGEKVALKDPNAFEDQN